MIQTFVHYQMLLCYDIKPKHGYTFFKRCSRFCYKNMPNFRNRRSRYLVFFPRKLSNIANFIDYIIGANSHFWDCNWKIHLH